MTKKDYLKIQAGFDEALKTLKNLPETNEFKRSAIKGFEMAVVMVSYQLAKDNPAFDYKKFVLPFGLKV